jgi:hypothetical protein
LHLAGILFPRINDDAQSKSHQVHHSVHTCHHWDLFWSIKSLTHTAGASTLILDPTQPPIHCELKFPSQGVILPGCEADKSSTFSADVKMLGVRPQLHYMP